MSADGTARDELGRRQAALVAALVSGAPPPPGFDTARTAVAAAALRAKRARGIAKTWPRLAAALGDVWPDELAAYVREVPAPPVSGPLSDGRALARRLAAAGRLPWEGRLELLAADVRHRWPRGGERRPRRLAVAVAATLRPRRLAVVWRAPGLGERWLRLERRDRGVSSGP